jgi:hypothetical protein
MEYRNWRVRAILRGAVTASAVAALALLAVPAAAAEHPAQGPVVPQVSCKPIPNGSICVRFLGDPNAPHGVSASYLKQAGNPVTIRLGYSSGSFSHLDDGYFVAAVRTEPYSYAWDGTNPGTCVTAFLQVLNGGTVTGPTLCR